MIPRYLIVIAVLMTACHRQGPATEPAPAVEAWKAEADKLDALIRAGMTQKEVLAVAGEPTQHRTIVSGTTVQIWDYEVGPKIYVRVFFDDHDRVTGTRIHSENKIGG